MDYGKFRLPGFSRHLRVCGVALSECADRASAKTEPQRGLEGRVVEAKDVARDLRELLPHAREIIKPRRLGGANLQQKTIEAWDEATSPARMKVLLDRLEELEANAFREEKYPVSRYELAYCDGMAAEVIDVGLGKWKIEETFGDVLNKSGEWEHEPNPSSRDQAFLERTRFDSVEEAFAVWEAMEVGDE